MSSTRRNDVEQRLRSLRSRERFSFPNGAAPRSFQRAAVLLLFWHEAGRNFLLLTRRASHLRTQPGRIAFPGGALEEGESWRDAALRETNEEVGIAPSQIEVVGMLDDAWAATGHHVVPVVAWSERPPRFTPNLSEVAATLPVATEDILEPQSHSSHRITLGEGVFETSSLELKAGRVLGMTADVLLEVSSWLRGERPAPGPRRLRELTAFVEGGQARPRLVEPPS